MTAAAAMTSTKVEYTKTAYSITGDYDDYALEEETKPLSLISTQTDSSYSFTFS